VARAGLYSKARFALRISGDPFAVQFGKHDACCLVGSGLVVRPPFPAIQIGGGPHTNLSVFACAHSAVRMTAQAC
jgi:hypothetical protein